MHLLVLDDELPIAHFIASVAMRDAWTVDAVATETEFHAKFKGRLPDAIVLDLRLGDSDGVRQLLFLRENGFTGPVVLMSGFDPRVLEAARSVGAAHGLWIATTLAKPLRLMQVRALLDDLRNWTIDRTVHRPASARSTRPFDFTPERIAQALSTGELLLHLQPIVAARGGVARLEALVRWQHPEYGLVPPLQFIPIAEADDALSERMTLWVVQRALDHHTELRDQGLDLPIAVNVSGNNLQSPQFPERISALIDAKGVAPSALSLEVTESVATRNFDRSVEVMSRLRLKGIAIAIDDLGTGYASLSVLRKMPFSGLKIDGSFTRDMVTSPDTHAIVTSLIDLAVKLNISSVAEGIEDEATAQRLVELGIDYMQGYHFSRPRPLSELLPWLKTQARAP